MLTVSKGTVSQNVSLEVDLAKGFMLQAELGKEDQGKVSLKWHHNY